MVSKKTVKKGRKSAPQETLLDLLVMKVQCLYDIENELVKALPKMAAHATNKELKQGFKDHLKETENQVRRLLDVFDLLDEKPKKQKVEAIRGLVKDAAFVMKTIKSPKALDANLIAAASYVEHYEMAGYISASVWAHELGLHEVESLLTETLEEEQAAEEKMRDLGEAEIDEQILPESDEDASEPSEDE